MSDTVGLILAALIAGVVTVLTTRWGKPKITAETESIAVSSLKESLLFLKQEVKELRLKVHDMEEQMEAILVDNEKLLRGNDILKGQVRELGGIPRWPPS